MQKKKKKREKSSKSFSLSPSIIVLFSLSGAAAVFMCKNRPFILTHHPFSGYKLLSGKGLTRRKKKK